MVVAANKHATSHDSIPNQDPIMAGGLHISHRPADYPNAHS